MITESTPAITETDEYKHLTIRQHFAAMALQGLLTKYSLNKPEDQQIVCQMSVELADELIKELNK